MALPRFERKPDQVGGIQLQDRDINIIHLVHDYRFLDSGQITALIGSSYQTTIRRLRKLYHHAFLDRPKSQAYLGWFKPREMVYALDDKGAEVLVEKAGLPREEVTGRWGRKNKEVKYRYMEHTLMISRFRATLTLALRDRAESKLLFWERESRDLRDKVYFLEGGKKRRLSIAPDGYFCIEDKGDLMYFFLEADRGTMTNKRFLRKMRGYWKWWKQGKHKKTFGIEAFRVLTVTYSERRKKNLRETTQAADDRNIGSSMFWFTSKERFDLEEPETILEPIWQIPRNGHRHRILE